MTVNRTVISFSLIVKHSLKGLKCHMTFIYIRCLPIPLSIFTKCQLLFIFEPGREKTGLRGFRPGPTQTGPYSHRRWLELEIFYLENRGIVLFV